MVLSVSLCSWVIAFCPPLSWKLPVDLLCVVCCRCRFLGCCDFWAEFNILSPDSGVHPTTVLLGHLALWGSTYASVSSLPFLSKWPQTGWSFPLKNIYLLVHIHSSKHWASLWHFPTCMEHFLSHPFPLSFPYTLFPSPVFPSSCLSPFYFHVYLWFHY